MFAGERHRITARRKDFIARPMAWKIAVIACPIVWKNVMMARPMARIPEHISSIVSQFVICMSDLDRVTKTTLARFSSDLKDKLSGVEKNLLTTSVTAHNYAMSGIDDLSSYVESRLMDAAFLRNATLRDPRLDEDGCKSVLAISSTDIVQCLTKLSPITASSIRIASDLHHCHTQKYCSLEEQLREAFKDGSPQHLVIQCCSRHQLILENMRRITIVVTAVWHSARDETGTKHRVFANLVANTAYGNST